jgi:hypothetical protein
MRIRTSFNAIIGFTTFVLGLFVLSCGETVIDRDRPREVLSWNNPDGFEPSYIASEDDSVRWGLFVSRRYSAKDNLWAVKSVDGGEWSDPVLLMNAYWTTGMEFETVRDTFVLTFFGIEDGYFYDYNIPFEDTLPFPDTVVVRLSLSDLRRDYDGDHVPDNIEREMLLSTRLPDSDLDGKNDDVDYSPLGIPVEHKEAFKIYKVALTNLLHLDDPGNLNPDQDTAWTRYYGVYYLHEQTVAYVALPGENTLPELLDLPIVTIFARSPLYFTNNRLYTSSTNGVMPHLVFYKPSIDIFGSGASMKIEYVAAKYRKESATVYLAKHDDEWTIERVTEDE